MEFLLFQESQTVKLSAFDEHSPVSCTQQNLVLLSVNQCEESQRTLAQTGLIIEEHKEHSSRAPFTPMMAITISVRIDK